MDLARQLPHVGGAGRGLGRSGSDHGAQTHPTARRGGRQSRRRGRGHPQTRVRAQRDPGELPRRGRHLDRGDGEGWRQQAAAGDGQRMRDTRGGPSHPLRASYHVQAVQVRGPQRHVHLRVQGRGSRVHLVRRQSHRDDHDEGRHARAQGGVLRRYTGRRRRETVRG